MGSRTSIVELFNRKFLYVLLISALLLLLFYSHILLPSPECPPTKPPNKPLQFYDIGLPPYPYYATQEKIRVIQLLSPGPKDGSSQAQSITLLHNTRKLTLFAVHELNTLVSDSPANPCSRTDPCLKWWANPLDTPSLRTTSYGTFDKHELIFIAEPGHVPFQVLVRQNHIPPKGAEWTELEFGKIIRLDGEDAASPPSFENMTFALTQDNVEDPELFSWPRSKSFLVGDYVDFKDEGMYKISPKVDTRGGYCGEALRMLIMVSSAPKHFEHRRIIRETYGAVENLWPKKVRLVFLFGLVPNATLQEALAAEAEAFDDIIQADFMDSYHNLSLSHLAMYNWIQRTCESSTLPKFVLKADDDFVLNIELALRIAYANQDYELIGCSFCGTSPIRDTAYMYKYYTPRYMHIPDRYAGYLSGVAYLVRTDIFPRMLQISLSTPMIHMDDAYITGMLPRQINITPVTSGFFTYGRGKLDPCSLRKMASSYVLNPKDMKVQWEILQKPIPSKCSLSDIEASLHILPPDHDYKRICDII